jgi:hypothetical protein
MPSVKSLQAPGSFRSRRPDQALEKIVVLNLWIDIPRFRRRQPAGGIRPPATNAIMPLAAKAMAAALRK